MNAASPHGQDASSKVPHPAQGGASQDVRDGGQAALADPSQAAALQRLDTIAMAAEFVVAAVDGDDALSARLASCGVWPGAVIERIASAPFGDPVLFRLHGYRLALRRSEAERVTVAPAASRSSSEAEVASPLERT